MRLFRGKKRQTKPIALVTAFGLAVLASGCGVFFGKDPQIIPAESKSTTEESVVERFARDLNARSSLARTSGLATSVRLKYVFPSLDVDKVVLGVAANERQKAEAQFFVAKDRPSSSISQLVLQNIVTEACAKTAASDNAVYLSDDALLPGEELPTDAARSAAFLAARKIWLYPYKETDPEVLELADLYSKVLANHSALAPAAAAEKAKAAICVAAFASPQFWMGNPGKLDSVRKLALEFALRVPRLSEFADIETGRVTLAQYVASLQAEPGYQKALRTWHHDWLGFEPQARVEKYKSVIPRISQGIPNDGSANGLAGSHFVYNNLTITGLDSSAKAVKVAKILAFGFEDRLEEHYKSNRSEVCDPVEQEFNHETSLITWEQFNPLTSRFELLVAHKKVGSTWTETNSVPGFFPATDHNGALLNATLNDIHSAPVSLYTPRTFKYRDQPTIDPVGTPPTTTKLASATNFASFGQGKLRTRRFDQNGVEQNGYSKVRLWWSDEEVYVCNAFSRFIATCAYRPAGTGKHYLIENISGIWTAAKTLAHWERYGVKPFSLGNGVALEHYSCGVPDAAQLEDDAFVEALAFPKKSATPPYYNTLATNITPATLVPSAPIRGAENDAEAQIAEDMNEEPYALISDIVSGGKDYRLLLTANYSIGRKALRNFYHTQGYYLPMRPEGFEIGPVATDVPTAFDASTMASFPRTWIRSPRNEYPHLYYRDAGIYGVKITNVTPRNMSGILTQASFINPMSPKTRSYASRIFERLLCTDPSGVTLEDSARDLHVSYMFTGDNKHLFDPKLPDDHPKNFEKKNCFACHVHLDPLGKALSKSFSTGTDLERNQIEFRYAAAGELHPFFNYNGPKRPSFWGLQGSSDPAAMGEGALLGKKITGGVREVGQVLADSREFAGCVTLKAFESVFGRKPSFPDAELIEETTSSFMGHYDYNRLIQELALSEGFLKEN